MDTRNLVQMANRIGEFFQAMPDTDEASREIVNHLRLFWEPRMRLALSAHLDSTDGDGMIDIVKQAMLTHRQALHHVAAGAARRPGQAD